MDVATGVASPEEAGKLLAVVPEQDRALWSTAFYAGLRRGELMALRLEDVDLASGVIRVECAWDAKGRLYVETKRRAGRRTIPIPAALRDYLDEHILSLDWMVGLHEARHTFASLMVAAGVNSKVLSTLIGHSSVAITLDRYAKLFEAQEREAAGLLDAYLADAHTRARDTVRLGAFPG